MMEYGTISGNDTLATAAASTGLEVNGEILLLGGWGVGGGEKGEEGVHFLVEFDGIDETREMDSAEEAVG